MKQEDRQLLLKDLSARLPYHPMVHIHDLDTIDYENYLYATYLDEMMSYLITLKPYLRPMSSMTEKERNEYGLVLCDELSINQYDWLNTHHFDYRGLIPRGLAIEAPEDMYKL